MAIIERDHPNGATTAAGMGHVVVLDDSPAQLALTQYSRSLWRELATELPAAAEYEPCGTIWVAADEEELVEVHAKQATHASLGIRSFTLTAKELADEEPNLRAGLAGALLVPEDVVLSPPAAAAYFLEEAAKHGAVLLQNQPVVQAGKGVVRLMRRYRTEGRGDRTCYRGGNIAPAVAADPEAQRTSGARRSTTRLSQPSTGRTRVSEKRAQACCRFSGLQHSAATRWRTDNRLLAAIRK